MMKILRDQRSALLPQHARLASLLALTAITVGILMGLGAVDLHETANNWVLQA